jgi:membrane protein YdbS with pleckstrin-like domain
MQKKKRMMKQLARRNRQEHAGAERRQRRGAEIRAEFERRRVWFVGLILALMILPVLLTLAPKEIWGSWAFLIVATLLIRVVPLVARYTIWRCPVCNKPLPISTKFGPFERRREECPHCGVRLE